MLDGAVVVVTGGAGLLGQSFVRAIAKQGGIAVVADIDIAAATSFVSDISSTYPGGAAVAAELDVTDKSSVCALIDKIENMYGRVDGLVNNAYPRNSNYGRKLEEVSYEDFCENVSSHLGGYFLVSQQFGLLFRERSGGSIVNMASIYGTMAPRFDIYSETNMTVPVEYAAIKSAIIQLTRYFAQYFKDDSVRVNSISPGGVLNNQPEAFLKQYNAHCGAKGMLDPEDITGSLLFLLSDSSKYITGQNIIIDDGFSL